MLLLLSWRLEGISRTLAILPLDELREPTRSNARLRNFQNSLEFYAQYDSPSSEVECGKMNEEDAGQSVMFGSNSYGTGPGLYFLVRTGQGWKSGVHCKTSERNLSTSMKGFPETRYIAYQLMKQFSIDC